VYTDTGVAGLSIRSLLELQAAQTPNAAALLAPGRETMTYAELLAQVNQARTALHSAGVCCGDRVVAIVSNGPEMAAAFLSIAGSAACAPLNPAYRESEFSFYLSDLAPKAIVVEQVLESSALAAAKDLGIPVIRLCPSLDGPAGSFCLEHDSPSTLGAYSDPSPPTQPDDIALVLHTSGTTSRPKQVPLSNANLCCSATYIRRALELSAADRCLNVMPLFHIHGLASALLASLAAGGSLICTPGFYAPRFLDWLTDFEPSWYTAVPTMHQAILARAGLERAGAHPRSTSLRFIRSSSAPLPPQVMAELERVFSVPVVEAYGMTEASHQMASNPLPPGRRKPGSVGRASGPEIAIMHDGRLVPSGVTGEIVIRGPNVMGGYVANADANESAFSSGWFRTGDLGWLDDESYLFISGRTKEIINRGGEKISPREIDEALLEHPAVAQALAFALPDARLGEEVAAAVVLKTGTVADESALREFVSGRLADFKVPRRIVLLDEIPKGPTGKPQRIGLAAILGLRESREPAEAQSEHLKPRTQSEKLVAGLWQQVLGRKDVGAQDNFFDLGGDSMLATQFLSRLAQSSGATPPLLRLFEQPTVQAMAAWLDANAAPTDTPSGALPLVRDPAAAASLSFAQQRFWFLDQYEQDSAAHVQSSAVRLRGRLDIDRLQLALNGIVARHEILRTTYDVRDGSPVGVLGLSRDLELKTVTATSLDAVSDLAAREARVRFHLAHDPMIRPVLARLGPHDHVLLLTRHHIASDGWSIEVLLRELATLYGGGALQDLPVQYSDYARWQTERYASGVFEEELAYWKEQLAGSASLLALPLDRPRPPRQTFRGARASFALPPAVAGALNDLARREGATLFMALLAAFQALLHRYSGADDVSVGCPVAGRGHVELEPLIGLFMNTLVLRSDASGNPAFRGLLARVRDTALGAFAHQELPFDKLVEALQPARSLSHSPLFQVLFQLRNLPFEPPRFADLECDPLDFDNGVVQFDLSLEIAPANGPLHCSLSYNADLFDAETALQITRHYRNLLAGAVQNPDRAISSLPILDADERRQLLSGWNQTEQPLPSRCVHELFEAQAARRPDAIAILDRNGELSYSDLNRAADRVADRLRLLGVRPGSLVAVCVERSRAMVAALLGILKAKCAFLPLDPLYPQERLAFMLEDSGATAVITKSGVAPPRIGLPLRRTCHHRPCFDRLRHLHLGLHRHSESGAGVPYRLGQYPGSVAE
jgi:acyl-CoA synthetase (AMP-forming)/AMP-acid ligase II